MAKPPAVQVPSDDYEVVVNGETYTPHEGEWVKVIPGATVASNRSVRTMMEMSTRLQAADGEPDEGQQVVGILDDANTDMIRFIADRVIAWNWTDDRGWQLPEIDGTVKPFERLSQPEVMYLFAVCQGKAPSVEKKGSVISPTISSASEQQPTPIPSSSARSRTKAS